MVVKVCYEEFEYYKGAIRVRISKMNRDNTMAKRKSTKGQTTICNTYMEN
jgi:hypothetical protein